MPAEGLQARVDGGEESGALGRDQALVLSGEPGLQVGKDAQGGRCRRRQVPVVRDAHGGGQPARRPAPLLGDDVDQDGVGDNVEGNLDEERAGCPPST